MARLPRIFVPGIPTHVIVRGNNRQDVFLSDSDRIQFHRCLVEQSHERGLAIHAYVLMSNHVHLLATGDDPSSLPKTIQSLGRRYVGHFNYVHKRSGTLWEGRYKSSLVETERYFLACQRYIELNPVRARMVGHPSEHPWSSYRRLAWGLADDLVSPHSLYEDLGHCADTRMAGYQELFNTEIDPITLSRIRDTIQHGWVLGSTAFCRKVEALAGRRPTRIPLGRPRKVKQEVEEVESDPTY